MDEGAMGRVHQADDAVVDGAIQQRRNMNHPIGRRGERQSRHLRHDLVRLLRVGNKDPHIAVSLAAGIGRDADFVCLNGGVCDQRRNPLATTGLIEPPAMVGAFDAVAVHLAERERHPPVGANVAHGCDGPLGGFADEDREAQQNGPFQTVGSEIAAEASGIPKAKQWRVLGVLNFCNEIAIHGKRKDARERTSLAVNIASRS